MVEALDQSKIAQLTANKGVMWHLNLPLAAHFGGVHETMIKAAKRAVNAVLGNADVTDEESTTAFTGAEALLNSRPLTNQSANPEDDIPLTPNHFLIGQIGGQFAPESVDETNYSLKKRWRRVQELVRHFWHRWLRRKQKKMAERGMRPSIRRFCLSHVAQHTTRALASRKSRRSILRKRWSCKSLESPSGKEPSDQTYFEVVSVGIAVKKRP